MVDDGQYQMSGHPMEEGRRHQPLHPFDSNYSNNNDPNVSHCAIAIMITPADNQHLKAFTYDRWHTKFPSASMKVDHTCSLLTLGLVLMCSPLSLGC